MAKFKLKLGRLPDFKLPITFQLPNGEEQTVVFTVEHKKATEIQEIFQAETPMSDKDTIMFMAKGWDLEDEFNEENVAEFVDLFPAGTIALTGSYMQALVGRRAKS